MGRTFRLGTDTQRLKGFLMIFVKILLLLILAIHEIGTHAECHYYSIPLCLVFGKGAKDQDTSEKRPFTGSLRGEDHDSQTNLSFKSLARQNEIEISESYRYLKMAYHQHYLP